MNWGELYPDAAAARTADQMLQPRTLTPAEPGVWQNFGSGAGNYFMRSMGEVARSASMAAIGLESLSPTSIAMRAVNPEVAEARRDEMFRQHDEVLQGAVDYWTPKPGTVGKAGEITGQLAGGLLQFALSPAVPVANAQLSTATDLTRAGVDPGAALVAGDIAGIGTALGVKAPFFGSTLVRKAASGAGVNLVQGTVTAGATNLLLQSANAPEQAAQFNAFDPTARTLDLLMGIAFGGVAHIQGKSVAKLRDSLSEEQRVALLTANQGHQLEQSAPHDLAVTQHVTEVQAAVEQLLRGERVTARPAEAAEPMEAATAAVNPEVDAALQGQQSITDRQGDRYRITIHQETLGAAKDTEGVFVQVFDPVTGQRRARIDFAVNPDGTLAAENTNVAQTFRRRGIAEAMYRAAIEAGYQVVPGRKQTDMGAAMVDRLQQKGVIGGERIVPGSIGANPKQLEMTTEALHLAAEMSPKPIIERPDMLVSKEPVKPAAPSKEPTSAKAPTPFKAEAQRALEQAPDLMIDSGRTNPDGTPERISAADHIAQAEEALAQAKGNDSSLFRTAAECLLGAL